MPELNTNGLPDWAARLLEEADQCLLKAVRNDDYRKSWSLDLSLDLLPNLGLPTRLVSVRVVNQGSNALELTARFQSFGVLREEVWCEYGNGWRKVGASKSNIPILPEIQMDAGIPSGLANLGNAYGRELRGDGWLGPSMGDLLNAVSEKAFAQQSARSTKPAAPEPPEIKSPNGRMIILKNPEDED